MDVNSKDFDVHFSINTAIEVNGKDEDAVIEVIDNIFVDRVIHQVEGIFHCGVDFDRDDFEMEKLRDGVFKVTLEWTGYWGLFAEDEEKAKNSGVKMLGEMKGLFKTFMNNLSSKKNQIKFLSIGKEKVTEVLEY